MLVIDSLLGGGTERSLADLLTCYPSRNVEPLVIALRQSGSEGFEEEVIRSGVIVLFSPPGSPFAQITWLRKLIRNHKPDLVHTMLAKADMIGRVAAWRTGVPLLCSLVIVPYEKERLKERNLSRWKVRLWQLMDIITSAFLVDHFHAVSESVKEGAVRRLRLAPEKITVVRRGRNEEKIGQPSPERKIEARRVLGLGREDIVLLNVGRCHYQKGQQYLLEAVSMLAPRWDRLRLLIAGRAGNASQELEAFTKSLGLNGRVSFLGHQREVTTLLTAADIFVFPSLYEGLPGAVIEAMALGLPIIASDIGPVRELAEEGKNALLVPLRSSGALSEAIERLMLEPRMRENFGKRSREIFLERFRLAASADDMVKLYRKVTENEGA
ncbi:MAG TPA: glycosyltransferase [Thermodesulfovibrionales bacterium]|nr:glycosyltransferase [Thermodesulfovibrionales bacterium]